MFVWSCKILSANSYPQKSIYFPKLSTGTRLSQSKPGSTSNINGLICFGWFGWCFFPSLNEKLNSYFYTVYLIQVQYKKKLHLSYTAQNTQETTISFLPHTHVHPVIAKGASTVLCSWTLAHQHDIYFASYLSAFTWGELFLWRGGFYFACFASSSKSQGQPLYVDWLCFRVSDRSGFTRTSQIIAESELKKTSQFECLLQ